MKKSWLLLLCLALVACGDKTPFPLPSSSGGGNGGPPPSPVASIVLTTNPSTLTFGKTASVSATVRDISDAFVPDGTEVTFTTSLGAVTSPGTTSNGIASATFTAGTAAGTAIIEALAGSISTSTQITVSAPQTGSIEFVSVSRSLIGIRGSGQPETSSITFRVKDISGNPAIDGLSVSFVMSGPSGGRLPGDGGEYIGELDDTPNSSSGATQGDGLATVVLNSGAVAGAVTVSASVSVSGSSATSSAPTISIGGGIASASHVNLEASVRNLPGLVFSNITSTISAFVADRSGNANVLPGTSVSFYTEAGAVFPSSGVTDSKGFVSVTLRTQAPDPFNVLSGDLHPINGHVTVLATLIGQEEFIDANGDGLYNEGEEFTDLPEPFIDRDDSGGYDPGEFFIDANGDGLYSEGNGVWDGPGCTGVGCLPGKTIWATIKLAFTGPATCSVTTTGTLPFVITNGTSKHFTITLGDINNNAPVTGTTITIAATKGTLSEPTSVTLGDIVEGPVTIGFTLADGDTDSTPDASIVSVLIKHGSLQGETIGDSSCSIAGTVQ